MKPELWDILPVKVCDAVQEPITRLARGWGVSPGRGWVQQAESGELRVACLSRRQRKEGVQGVMDCKQSSRCWQVPWLDHKEPGERTWCKTLRDDMDRAVPIPVGQVEDRKAILYFSLLAFLSLQEKGIVPSNQPKSRRDAKILTPGWPTPSHSTLCWMPDIPQLETQERGTT